MRHRPAGEPRRDDPFVARQALEAQAALAPLALAAFGLSLPMLVWLGARAPNAAWMSVGFVLFAIAWGGVFALTQALRTPGPIPPSRQVTGHLLAGLIWAGAIGQICLFALDAGPFRTPLLLVALASAMVCVVFAAPWTLSLLVVAPAALSVPLAALLAGPRTQALAWAALAVAVALGLIVNRVLHRQFVLAAARERRLTELAARAEQAAAAMVPVSALLAAERLSVPSPAVARILAQALGAEHAANDRSVA